MEGNAIKPLRFAVKYEPPVIVMEYERWKRGEKKLRMRKMPVRGAKESGADAYALTRRLFEKHPDHLSPSWVKFEQLENLVTRIVHYHVNAVDVEEEVEEVEGEEEEVGVGGVNYNVLTDEERAAENAKMDAEFAARVLRPGDPGYQYDVREDFSSGEESCDWDDLIPEPTPVMSGSTSLPTTTPTTAAPTEYDQEDDDFESVSSSSSASTISSAPPPSISSGDMSF